MTLWSTAHMLPTLPRRPVDLPEFALDLQQWMTDGGAARQARQCFDVTADDLLVYPGEARRVPAASLVFASAQMCELLEAIAPDYPLDADLGELFLNHFLVVFETPIRIWEGHDDLFAGIYVRGRRAMALLAHTPHADRVVAMTQAVTLDSDAGDRAGWPPEDQRVWALLTGTVATLSQRVARRTDVTIDRPAKRRLARLGLDDLPPVQMIDLRRTEARHDTKGDGQRTYSHQWWVPPFWRRQWYPTRNRHEAKLVVGHLRGPADRPILNRQRLYRLKR